MLPRFARFAARLRRAASLSARSRVSTPRALGRGRPSCERRRSRRSLSTSSNSRAQRPSGRRRRSGGGSSPCDTFLARVLGARRPGRGRRLRRGPEAEHRTASRQVLHERRPHRIPISPHAPAELPQNTERLLLRPRESGDMSRPFRWWKQALSAASLALRGTERMRRSCAGVRWKSPRLSGFGCGTPCCRMHAAYRDDATYGFVL